MRGVGSTGRRSNLSQLAIPLYKQRARLSTSPRDQLFFSGAWPAHSQHLARQIAVTAYYFKRTRKNIRVQRQMCGDCYCLQSDRIGVAPSTPETAALAPLCVGGAIANGEGIVLTKFTRPEVEIEPALSVPPYPVHCDKATSLIGQCGLA
jgi:hypothetical protein